MGVAGVAAAVSRCCAATKTTLATLREQDPGLARQVEALTYHGLDTIIAGPGGGCARLARRRRARSRAVRERPAVVLGRAASIPRPTPAVAFGR